MPSPFASVRRLNVLLRTLNTTNKGFQPLNVRVCSTQEKVAIGEVTKVLKPTSHPEYIPRKYCKWKNIHFFVKKRIV